MVSLRTWSTHGGFSTSMLVYRRVMLDIQFGFAVCWWFGFLFPMGNSLGLGIFVGNMGNVLGVTSHHSSQTHGVSRARNGMFYHGSCGASPTPSQVHWVNLDLRTEPVLKSVAMDINGKIIVYNSPAAKNDVAVVCLVSKIHHERFAQWPPPMVQQLQGHLSEGQWWTRRPGDGLVSSQEIHGSQPQSTIKIRYSWRSKRISWS